MKAALPDLMPRYRRIKIRF